MNRIPVVVVTYYPTERVIDSVRLMQSNENVGEIVVVDNTPEQTELVAQLRHFTKVCLILNKRNKGIATAQNQGLDLFVKKGYMWAMTLDQDTIPKADLFEKYITYYKSHETSHIGIISTDYYDVGTEKIKFGCDNSIETDEVISSGALINLNIYLKVGGMKDRYFIDQVDNEYCYRIRRKGYKIVVLPGSGMEHKLGNITCKNVFGKKFYLYNQSPIRTYYRTRNIIYMLNEYPERELQKRKKKALRDDFIRILFEKEKLKKVKMFLKGLYDGYRLKEEEKAL